MTVCRYCKEVIRTDETLVENDDGDYHLDCEPLDIDPSPKRINKYLYGWKLYVNYGQGWEYELFEETFAGYKENRKAYRENCDYPQRWSRGRETNPEYVEREKIVAKH